MKNKTVSTIIAVLEIIMIPIFILSFAIIVPIAFRPFYYWQIGPLGIVESSGFTEQQIIQAFNDVLDFIWLRTPFKVGDLKYSEEGMAHFQDCVPLFHLDLNLLLISGHFLLTTFVLKRVKAIEPRRFFGFPSAYYGAAILLLMVVAVGIFGFIDFNGLFVAFHSLFFPGKSNWIFNENTDEFIKILPETFIMNCGVYIGAVSGGLTLGCLIYGVIIKIKTSNKAAKQELNS